MAVCILVMTFILANGSIEDELFCRNLYLFEMLKRVSIGSHTMNSKMREALSSDLNGLVSGGRPPEKLLQVSLNHAMFPS
jgi:hypothetical protein